MRPAVALALAVTVSIAHTALAAPVVGATQGPDDVQAAQVAAASQHALADTVPPLARPAAELGHVEGELAGAATNTLIVAEPGTIALLGLGLVGLGLARRRAAREKHPRS